MCLKAKTFCLHALPCWRLNALSVIPDSWSTWLSICLTILHLSTLFSADAMEIRNGRSVLETETTNATTATSAWQQDRWMRTTTKNACNWEREREREQWWRSEQSQQQQQQQQQQRKQGGLATEHHFAVWCNQNTRTSNSSNIAWPIRQMFLELSNNNRNDFISWETTPCDSRFNPPLFMVLLWLHSDMFLLRRKTSTAIATDAMQQHDKHPSKIVPNSCWNLINFSIDS